MTIAPVAFFPDDTDTPEDPPEAAAGVPRDAVAASPEPLLLDPSNKKLYTRGIIKLQKVPVVGFVGLNGHGKTYNMIRSILPSLAEGARILSTVTLLDPHTGNEHPQFTRLHSWRQLLDFSDGIVCLDEILGMMDARDQAMPKPVRRHIHQMRHYGTPVRWTGVDWDNTDRRMRQITSAVVRCRGHMPVRSASKVTLWAPNRLFVFTTFDAQTLTSSEDSAAFTEDKHKRKKARVLHREYVWGPGSVAFRCYDTLGAVSWVDNSCQHCGGKITDRICRNHGEH